MNQLPHIEIVDIELLLKIIAWLVGAIIGLMIYTWLRFEKKQDQLISQLTMFIEEFTELKKDTEYLKKDVGEIKLDIHSIKQKINLV